MLEKDFVAKLTRELKKLPSVWFYKSCELSVRGVPDIIGVYNSVFFGLECKRSSKAKVTELQQHVLNRINEAGGLGLVVYPENMDKVIILLKKYCTHGLDVV